MPERFQVGAKLFASLVGRKKNRAKTILYTVYSETTMYTVHVYSTCISLYFTDSHGYWLVLFLQHQHHKDLKIVKLLELKMMQKAFW